MSREEFMRTSPRYFAQLRGRHEEKCKREAEMTEVMGAQIVAMVRCCGFAQWTEQKGAVDFMPSRWNSQRGKNAKPKKISKAEKLKEIEAIRKYWRLASGWKPKVS